jgi:hypothetical protein
MNRSHIWLLVACLQLSVVLRAADFGTLPDPYIGNWSGTLTTGDREEPVHATVIPYKQRYEVTLRAKPDPRAEARITLTGRVNKDQLVLESQAKKSPAWRGQATADAMSGTFGDSGRFALRKVPFQQSPTLGAKAPSEAVVLFDGTHLDAWESTQAPADKIQWKIMKSGALEVVSSRDGKRNKQDIATKELFGDYRLHLEFKLVHKPNATGQRRSNSGIIHLKMYETQILDSFGLYGRDNECGGIYKTRDPDSNAGYPASLWQTYDVDVKAPRFDAGGTKTADARMTVRLNGVLIHNDVVVPKPTLGDNEKARGPILLQDHGNAVQFRNIWVVKLDH